MASLESGTRIRRAANLDLAARHAGFTYQLQAVEAVKGLPYAALFHEQGLGKTKIGIDLALEWLRSQEVDTVLFVTKRSLVQNWVEEIAAHSHLKARVLDQNHSSNFYALNSPTPVFLAHYEVLRSEERRLALFLKTRRVAVILDEAHKIKNPQAELTQALHRLAPGFARRVIMTGTPVANRPYDLWSQIFFLDGGKALGRDFPSFKAKLDLTNDLWEDQALRESFEMELESVFARIAPFTVRETKATAGLQLPDKRVSNVSMPLAPRQRELYDSIRNELRATVVFGDKVVEDDAEEVLKRLLRLVQLASNPRLVDESYFEAPGKLAPLHRLVSEAVGAGSKIIVWTSFVANADWLAHEFAEYGAVKVHGALEMDARNAALAAFKTDQRAKVLVATPGAAKEGLTLTVANHAVFFDRSFSLDDYLQAQDRIHRISQTQTCFIWNLIGTDTVDEWVDSLLAAKRLAAQLAQADVSREEYGRLADYDFGRAIREILGADE
ncbi:DEAD/DEAH box helicase [Azospirillum sp. TSO22-1]|uniref:DEAD/DEAH box helicase n=1 Tax=Azospirillum sp. TSO22-1 TaxID=716789 RepID=UPI000D61BE15|nr:DEAD/DEAH box helicase [Azospirillum sp. TSO22-1]PWC36759.1 helicase [Azospirillum sp. TSO22-1]